MPRNRFALHLLSLGALLGGCKTETTPVPFTAAARFERNAEGRELTVVAIHGPPNAMIGVTPAGAFRVDPRGPAQYVYGHLGPRGQGEFTIAACDGAAAACDVAVRVSLPVIKSLFGSQRPESRQTLHVVRTFALRQGQFGRVRCVGRSCEAHLGLTGTANDVTGLVLEATGFPPGTALSVGGQTLTVTRERVSQALEMPQLLADTDPHALTGSQPMLPFRVRLPDGTTAEDRIQADSGSLEHLIKAFFSGLRAGRAVTFPTEGQGNALLYLPGRDVGSGGIRLVGSAAVLRDAGRMALDEELPDRVTSCGSYRSSRTGGTVTLHAIQTSVRVNVFERRIGRRLASRVFTSARPDCASAVREAGDFSTLLDRGPVLQWLGTL